MLAKNVKLLCVRPLAPSFLKDPMYTGSYVFRLSRIREVFVGLPTTSTVFCQQTQPGSSGQPREQKPSETLALRNHVPPVNRKLTAIITQPYSSTACVLCVRRLVIEPTLFDADTTPLCFEYMTFCGRTPRPHL